MELLRALAVLAEPPGPEAVRLAELLDLPGTPNELDHTDLFLFELYPYASVYTGPEGQLGGEARDRVAGFWHALGLDVPKEPDHLAALLGLYATLADHEANETHEERRGALRAARHALFWEHVASWVPVYLSRAEQIGSTTYAAWATLLDAALIEEARRLGEPAALPRHLAHAPALPPHEADADEWARALLTPVRTGLIVTRSDLARCARDLGLGLRAGERRFALQALLEQDAGATLGWMAQEAGQRAAATRARRPPAVEIAEWWASRAADTAAALVTLRTEETIDA